MTQNTGLDNMDWIQKTVNKYVFCLNTQNQV